MATVALSNNGRICLLSAPLCVSGPISKGVSFAGKPGWDFSLKCLLADRSRP